MTAVPSVQTVVVFGGSGFLGSEIVKCLAGDNAGVRTAVRHLDSAAADALARHSPLIKPVYADVRDETSVALAMEGCEAAVNAVGLYVESKKETFEAVHEIGAVNVAHQAAVLGLKKVVHISGIGADPNSGCAYVHARGKAELLVADIFPNATLLRPSVMFGPTDKFLNTLVQILSRTPVLPLFGSGTTKLQPVFVGDVARAVCNAIRSDEAGGKTYELGGPHIYSYRSLIELLLAHTRRKRLFVPVPFALWDLLAKAAAVLPHPPITAAQVNLMRRDNVVAKSALTFEDLGLTPAALEGILHMYAFARR